MNTDDRTQFAALLGLLAALLGTLWALHKGLEPLPVVQVAGLAYAAVLAVVVPTLQVSVVSAVVFSAKATGLVAVGSVVVTVSGTYAGYQLLRNRQRAVIA